MNLSHDLETAKECYSKVSVLDALCQFRGHFGLGIVSLLEKNTIQARHHFDEGFASLEKYTLFFPSEYFLVGKICHVYIKNKQKAFKFMTLAAEAGSHEAAGVLSLWNQPTIETLFMKLEDKDESPSKKKTKIDKNRQK